MLFQDMIIDNTYQIVNEIGSGGMGVVYLGYHLRLQKYVVLKKIKNAGVKLSMLRNEVDILKSLHHPYLPQVYDFIEYKGDLYTVIDYIEGYDLNYYIKNQYVFSESQLIKWLVQLCEVLKYLHEHSPRILHTDIKPGNIIVNADGDICLIDFGISLAQTDVIMGLSRYYSSPEQYNNFYYLKFGSGRYANLDERTDIYSLGATFYHLISGIRPDVTDEDRTLLTQLSLPYSDALAGIIDKMMNRHPEQRYRNANELLKAIRNIKKQNAQYRLFLLIQIIFSTVAVLLVVLGIVLIISGYQSDLTARYEESYRQFVAFSNHGDTEQAIETGQRILNTKEFSSLLTDTVKARILHKIGDNYSESENYYNAAYYYEQSLLFEPNDLVYRDYAMALLNDNQLEKARSVIEELRSEYENSTAATVVQAQVYYENREYEAAVNEINAAGDRLSGDTENNYTAQIIKGDALMKLDKADEAEQSYETAISIKNTLSAQRKLGEAYLCSGRNGKTVSYRSAIDLYERIIGDYAISAEDIINYTQACLSVNAQDRYDRCSELLKSVAEQSRNCRLYIVMAILADKTGNDNVAEYCRKARQLFDSMEKEERLLIDPAIYDEIRAMYKKYCGQEW